MGAAAASPCSGILLVDKPAGWSSHDVVARVRRIFRQREVGHTGTLDPMATGLLVLVLGRATRIARFIEAADKLYEGTVFLGRATTTYDAQGATTAEVPVGGLDPGIIGQVLRGLIGVLSQRPPPYSAIKVAGERLYAKARRGEEVLASPREITIHTLEAIHTDLPAVAIRTRVSKGTYIRSLAVEIGARLGFPAHLSALRRFSVGSHRIEVARPLEALLGQVDELVTIETALAHLPAIGLDQRLSLAVAHGRVLSTAELRGCPGDQFQMGDAMRLLDSEGRVQAIAFARVGREGASETEERGLDYACVLAGSV